MWHWLAHITHQLLALATLRLAPYHSAHGPITLPMGSLASTSSIAVVEKASTAPTDHEALQVPLSGVSFGPKGLLCMRLKVAMP